MPRNGKTARGRTYQRMTLEEQFWPKVDKNGPVPAHCPELGPCWVWTASLKTSGYGELGHDRKNMPAHRASWILAGRPLPQRGQEFCHKCDNRQCVNPDHLFIGTRGDNMRDCSSKGRSAFQVHPERAPRGARHGSKTHPERVLRGDAHPESKATDAQVHEMIALRQRGMLLREIASRYGVSVSCVHLICTGKARKHLHGESYADQIKAAE